MHKIPKVLSLFDGEAPEGSLALVAYTVTSYIAKSNAGTNLSFNIMWLAILAAGRSMIGFVSLGFYPTFIN